MTTWTIISLAIGAGLIGAGLSVLLAKSEDGSEIRKFEKFQEAFNRDRRS